MKLMDKIKNRYNIIALVLAILMFILSFRLATLTIAQGDYYRDLSDNKRLKEIYTTAPRGEIRDRYGRLLAGNKPSFTVQLLKDELNLYEREKKNEAFLTLIRLLEEDGVDYVDEFPIELNTFKYKTENDYVLESQSPLDKVIEIIIENNLLSEVLNSHYIYEEYKEHYQFITANRGINALKNKGIDIPIDIQLIDEQLVVKFHENRDIGLWKSQYGINPNASAIDALIQLINNDKTIIRKIIDHSVSRNLVYDILKGKGLDGNLDLEEYSISYMSDFLNQKRTLAKIYPEVTIESTAKDDFINIFIKTSLNKFLERSIDIGEGEVILPGKILLDMLKDKGIEVPINVELGEDKTSVIYSHIGEKEIEVENPVDLLIKYSKKTNILADFIINDNIKSLAQEQMLNDGVNPRISIANDFEYVDINNLNNFYTQNNIEEGSSAKEAFKILRQNYGIDEKLSKYETRAIFILYNQLKKQGYLAYQPINIAYGIKDSTVARIEESLMEVPGIGVSIEPVRYYPEGTTAAHILGYLGKISQPNEIKKYVEERQYSPNAIIGKTGIEESFEEVLSGISGIKKVDVDSIGNTTKVIEEKKPVPGDNIYLTIDLKLQKVAEEALEQTLRELSRGGTYRSPWGDYQFGIHRKKNRPYKNATSGAVVAVDVKTGQVLASASYPPYDPNLFATGISNTDWLSLFPENEDDQLAPRPLYNIATQTAVQPGSVFKMVTALAALENGLSPTKKIRDMGFVEIGTKSFNCLVWTQSRSTHGYENVYEALRDSCNYYFYTLALGKNQRTNEPLGVKVSIEDIVEVSKKLGLNDKTGIEINIPSEVSGGVPDPQRKIINTKYLLKSFLNKNIDKYFKEDFDYDDEYKDEIIEEIISWTEYEDILTRGEVVRRLDSFGILPEKKLPGDREGLADKIKYTYLNFARWNITDTLNVTIGQGESAYTPIQMANYIATLSNGGYIHNLTLVDNIKNYNNSKINYIHEPSPRRIQLNNYDNLEHVKQGMYLVSKEGTARRVFQNFPVEVGSKTGTAEKSGINPATGDTYDDFAWFVGFAPYDDPEIAVAAVIFQGGSGGYAGPLVRDIIAEYLGLNKIETKESLPYDNILSR